MPAATKRRKGATAKLREQTLRLPVAQGVRVVALGFLDDAEAASKRLARDSKALRRFRVALRRLRSWLRSFQPEFEGIAKKKDRRALRDITDATSLSRDIDVHLVWLRRAGKGLSQKRRRGADWMKEYLKWQQLTVDPADADLLKKFSRIRKDLGERLSADQPVNTSVAGPTLASVIASRLTSHVEDLDEALAEVSSVTDEEQAHQARIAAKRLRYLIEPAVPHVKQGDDLLRMLKSLQDELGALHDAHLLAHELSAAIESSAVAGAARLAKQAIEHAMSRDNQDGAAAGHMSDVPQSALGSLGRRLGDDAQKAFDRVHKDWLSERYARFKRDLAAFAKRLDETYGQAKAK